MKSIPLRVLSHLYIAAIFIFSFILSPVVTAADPQSEVTKAITLLRKTPSPETHEAARDLWEDPGIRKAWNTIAESGAPGLAALQNALSDITASERVLIVAGGSLLWRLGGLAEAEEIGELWTKYDLPPGFGSSVLHATAYAAARTRDPRALPILFAVFRDTDALVDIPRARITLIWPETLDFVWGAYGPQGREALAKALADSRDRDFQASAAWLLAKDGYTEALPAIRRIACSEERGIARETAIRALGIFGHPDDFALLACGLKRLEGYILGPNEVSLAEAYIDALAEYGDMRGSKVIKSFLDAAGNEMLRGRARFLLVNLLTPDSLSYLREESESLQGDARQEWDATLERLFAAVGVTPEEYAAMDSEGQRAALDGFRAGMEDAFTPRSDEKPLDRAWLKSRIVRLRAGKQLLTAEPEEADKLLPRRYLATATPADIPEILEARATVAGSLTEDALADMDILSAMAIRIARASYRQVPGLTDEVRSK